MPTLESIYQEYHAKAFTDLVELCGHLQDGSQTTVKLSQDDATRTCHITVGNKEYHGPNWVEAINNAAKDQ